MVRNLEHQHQAAPITQLNNATNRHNVTAVKTVRKCDEAAPNAMKIQHSLSSVRKELYRANNKMYSKILTNKVLSKMSCLKAAGETNSFFFTSFLLSIGFLSNGDHHIAAVIFINKKQRIVTYKVLI